MSTYAEQLAEFIVGVSPDETVLLDARLRVLDTLGNSIAALEDSDADAPFRLVRRHVEQQGGTGASSLFGTDVLLPPAQASFYLGTLAHSLDFDDTHLPSVLHPSASVIPAALATAEGLGASGRDLLRAASLGIEVCNRLGMASYDPATRNSVFFEKGFHATSICGTIGAAVAVSTLMGASAAQVMSAMGVAASMGAGIIEANRTGGTVKRIHCGWAAKAGTEAAQLAVAGLTGPPTVFEGRFGFFRAYVDVAPDPDALVRDLGTSWESVRTVFKPYPSNHFTHPGIDCALALKAQGLDPDRVRRITLGVAGAPRNTIGEPRDEKAAPRTPYHAKFSGPFTVATALVGGSGLGVGADDFSEQAFHDPRRLRLAGLTEVVADEQCDEEFPRSFSAVLDVETDDGRTWHHRVTSSLGSPEHPLTVDDVMTKFALNAGRVLGEVEVRELTSLLEGLDGAPTLTGFLRALRTDGAG